MAGEKFSARRKKGSSGLIWGIFSVVFLIFMIKWGVPWFVNVLAGPTGPKGNTLNSNEDIVPPQTPTLFPLPEATNSANLKIEGFSEENVEINVFRNDELMQNDKTDDKGSFMVEIKLTEGENRIQVKARDKAGNESQSPIRIVMFDRKNAEITLDSPKDGTEIFGKNNQTIPVSGKVSKVDSVVTVNGNFARVGSDGSFSVTIKLNKGDNDVTVKATDKAGNTVEKSIKVKLTF